MMVNLEFKNPLLSTHSSNFVFNDFILFHSSPIFSRKLGSFENV